MSLFTWYFIITGLFAGVSAASTQTDSDIRVYYFTICFLVGWLTFPYKLIMGFIKTYNQNAMKQIQKQKMND